MVDPKPEIEVKILREDGYFEPYLVWYLSPGDKSFMQYGFCKTPLRKKDPTLPTAVNIFRQSLIEKIIQLGLLTREEFSAPIFAEITTLWRAIEFYTVSGVEWNCLSFPESKEWFHASQDILREQFPKEISRLILDYLPTAGRILQHYISFRKTFETYLPGQLNKELATLSDQGIAAYFEKWPELRTPWSGNPLTSDEITHCIYRLWCHSLTPTLGKDIASIVAEYLTHHVGHWGPIGPIGPLFYPRVLGHNNDYII